MTQCTDDLDALFASLPATMRWDALVAALEPLVARAPDDAALFDALEARLAGWPAVERKAPEAWWIETSREEIDDYGVGTAVEERFRGFRSRCHPLFRLARAAEIWLSPLSLLVPYEFRDFELNADLSHIEWLKLSVPVGAPCLRHIMTSPKFGALRQLSVNTRYLKDDALLAEFDAWRAARGITRT